MARTHARILTAIWSNDDFRTLSSDAQRTYLLILSQPDLTICGVLDYNPKRLARLAADTTVAKIAKAVATLEQRRYVLVDHDTDELAVRTFLRHDGVADMPNPLKAAARAWSSIHSPTIRAAVVDALPEPIRALWPKPLLSMDAKQIGELIRQGSDEPKDEGLPEGFPQPLGEPPGSLSLSLPLSSSGPPDPPGAASKGSTLQHAANGAAAPDDDREQLKTQVVELLAERRADLEHPDGEGINQPGPYRQKLLDDHQQRFGPAIDTLADQQPHWDAAQIANNLDPQTAIREPVYADEILADNARRRAQATPMPDDVKQLRKKLA